MIVEGKDSNVLLGLKDILIRNNKKLLKIFYGGNGDLYLDIFGDYHKEGNGYRWSTFSISMEEDVYPYFAQFIHDIRDCNVFDETGANQKLKNSAMYQQLVQEKSIVWFSDNIYEEKANQLILKQNKNEITFTFIDNPEDPTFGFGIRVCNSGSRYDPFHLCFMKLFQQLSFFVKEKETKKLIK